MIENKKIRGTNPKIYKGITFKSTLECSCYQKLEKTNLNFSYESEKIILWEGFKLNNVKLYSPKKLNKGKYDKNLILQTRAILNITYTPDFIVTKDNYKIYFDIKGKENDTYPLKKKMFLKYLENKKDGLIYMFFEPHTVKQMIQAITIIENL
jgi:hypothetical protein